MVLLPCSVFCVLALLAFTAGVNHWRLQDGVIRAVGGRTIITNKPPSSEEEEYGEEGSEGKDVIYDEELYLLMTQTKKSKATHTTLIKYTEKLYTGK